MIAADPTFKPELRSTRRNPTQGAGHPKAGGRWGRRPVGPEAGGPEAVGPKAGGPEAGGPEAGGPEADGAGGRWSRRPMEPKADGAECERPKGRVGGGKTATLQEKVMVA
ncbi:hypothetical protein Amac_087350 [Acrocarpospora macrocephala]|uniref:Uncharacterized protein n=1 Tax=Acrocarpospora macrocephala TaxID=150177 RepID=A0A5M3XAN3_9ACTN|nr:hypothetical protein Amac_087350 [Acrocarpospora macrocephala]